MKKMKSLLNTSRIKGRDHHHYEERVNPLPV